MLANYHTHTRRCHHADGGDRAYVEAAVQAGLKVLGFSDHCPWVYPDGFVSSIRMLPSEVDGYFSSLEHLRKEYEKDIEIYIGYEAEHTPELIGEQDALLADYPLDYMILGQHFLGPNDRMPYTGAPTGLESVLEEYVDSVIDGMRSGRYLYLAHPDLIHFTGPVEIYDKHMTRLCRELKEMDALLEFNVLGLVGNRHYPSGRFLEIAGAVGNTFVLGTDAHTPGQLRDLDAFRRAEETCSKFGLHLVDGLGLLGTR